MSLEARRKTAQILLGLDEVEIEVEKMVAGGDGLARYRGVPLFVAGGLPGDRLRARVVERRPDFARVEIVEILEAGPGRREAPCRFYERCGGCDLQHLADEMQGRLKAAAARETLERIGGLRDLPEARLLEGDSWGYRLRAQLRTSFDDEEGPRVGYFAAGTHEVVAIDHCPILDAELDDRLVDLAEAVTAESPRRLDLAVGDGGAVTCSPLFDDQPRGAVERRVGDFVYRYDARAFFQGHAGLLRDLVAAVCGDWSGEQAFDLYAGVGLFSLPLATRYERVTAVEGDRGSSRFARINARANRLGNVAVETRSIETWIEALPAGADRVVVDPPRSGLPRPVVAGLIERRPRRLTYLSCHAATLARDLRVLDASYRIESLDFFDLFPQTVHLETLVQLVLREG